jgi:hypothetical protein
MHIHPIISLWLYSPLTLAASSVSQCYTQTARLLGRGISPSQGRYLQPEQHKLRISVHRHPRLEWDWNSRPQYSSWRRRFMLQTARPLRSASLFLLFVNKNPVPSKFTYLQIFVMTTIPSRIVPNLRWVLVRAPKRRLEFNSKVVYVEIRWIL